MILIPISVFIFGAIIGSFLNVVILRLGTGVGINGYSFCFSCRKELKWYELIPILSFFLQRGRCRKCYSKISWQYPIVEMLTGLVFLLIFNFSAIGGPALGWQFIINIAYYWLIFSILIVIAVYDFRHKIIPDKLVWLFVLLSLFSFLFRVNSLDIRAYLLLLDNILAGIALSLPLALIWLLSKGRLMGLGDAKLALGIGFLLGLSKGIVAFVLSFWIGAIFGIILIILSRLFRATFFRNFRRKGVYLRGYPHLSASSEIPFGPFLILSTFLVFLFDLDLISFLSLFVRQ